jgi:NAD(P)-dependent dehydrogenase (short-subunit alcohol dehydrogenase family)
MAGAALVTGAAGGIGRAIAVALAEAGFAMALSDREASAALDAATAEAAGRGVRTVALPADLADLAAHAGLLDAAEAALGPLTTLVNNAGVSVLARGDLLDVSVDSYDRCQAVNTRGTFFLTQAFARRLLAAEAPVQGHRSIVTITSANAVGVSLNRGEYCVSKAGLSMASRLFAARLGGEGIGVYEIQPGVIETAMTAPSMASYRERIAGGLTVIPRVGQPAEVARAVVTCATGGLPYTVGQAIRVDGGLVEPRF